VATPNIDRVAGAGVRFDQALTAAPTTLAAHTSIMTGTYPHTHGVPRNGFSIDEGNVMLATVLKDAGYRTAAFLGSFALSSDFGFNHGFDWFDEDFDVPITEYVTDQEQRRAETVTDRVLEYLDRAGEDDEGLFLFVHYFDAHVPYAPPAPYDTLYGQSDGVPEATFNFVSNMAIVHRKHLGDAREVRLNRLGLTAELIHAADGKPIAVEPELAALYAGEVSYMDEHVGRLLDGLEERGILDDALLVITADHGETFWEHADFWNHGLWVYDTTARVPLIVRMPKGATVPRVVTTPVSTVDIMPTVLELLGVGVPAGVEGTSLLPALRGDSLAHGPVFCEATQPWRQPSHDHPWPNALNPRCIRSGGMKYVFAPYAELEELYDIAADPGERVDLLRWNRARSLERRNALRAELDAWSALADPLPLHAGTMESEKIRKKLESLGYIGGRVAPDTAIGE
jgi:arylsulfatase A-like enzyme